MIAIVILLFSGCYPEGVESNSDFDLLISAWDPEMDFTQLQTFKLHDSLVLLNDETANNILELEDSDKQAIIDRVRDNLDANGWVDSSQSEIAQTRVVVSMVVAKYSDEIWKQWAWYEDLDNVTPIEQSPKYDWYPNYFPYVFDFVRGSIIITMDNTSSGTLNITAVPVIWVGAIDEIVTSKKLNLTKINSRIDKLFTLTENLHKN